MATREYAGAAKRTAITGDITAASTTITVTDATGYPTGATGPFAIALELGAAAEEKVLIASRSGNTLTVDTRGYDGTTAAAHSSGATVDHVLTAIDIREANTHINKAANAHDATAISFTAAAGITATSVQAAIEEVVSDANAAYALKAEGANPYSNIDNDEATTSTSYVDLTTVGPSISVTVPASGKIRIDWSAEMYNGWGRMSFALSGANVAAAGDGVSITSQPAGGISTAAAFLVLSGLTPGVTTITAKYRSPDATTARFVRRRLLARPLSQ